MDHFSPFQYLVIKNPGNIEHRMGSKNGIPVLDITEPARNVELSSVPDTLVAVPYQLNAIRQHAFYYPSVNVELCSLKVIDINCCGHTCGGLQVSARVV